MPELPEVETVVRGISPFLLEKEISKVWFSGAKFRGGNTSFETDSARDAVISSVERRAKYIQINLSNKKSIIIHLGMSGKLTIQDDNTEKKHDHLRVYFKNHNSYLNFNDARRFGVVDIIDSNNISSCKHYINLGIEPLTKEFDCDYLYNICSRRSVPIKVLIMNANLIVGVGNIYASEALFRAKILPTRISKSLTKKECNLLCKSIKVVLEDAIKSGGSTLRDYVRSDGSLGYFQHKFNVYGRKKQKCITCNDLIEQIVQAGRSTFFCKSCQS